ncbi:hypothetical protein B4135_1392 [Caldibacillus debilis]|uniref:Uncharacterized protein n=1 Tax=Caldibacillus debilis TaxID=301148 RepID=A0A150MD84_9BACI|nr:hypothetical protein B4135_1392 [Caldibacillus debilis]
MSNILSRTFNIGYGLNDGMSNILAGWFDIGKKTSNTA